MYELEVLVKIAADPEQPVVSLDLDQLMNMIKAKTEQTQSFIGALYEIEEDNSPAFEDKKRS